MTTLKTTTNTNVIKSGTISRIIKYGSQGSRYVGSWSNLTTYTKGLIVSHKGATFIATQTSLNQEPPNATYWSVIAQGFNFRGAWGSGINYEVNDVVTHAGSTWISVTDSLNIVPGTNPTYWTALATAGVNGSSSTDLPSIPVSTFKTLQDMHKIYHSSGWVNGGVATSNGDGTVTVSAGTGAIRATDDNLDSLLFFDWAAVASLTLIDNSLNYIYVEYNAGSPQVISTTTERTDIQTNLYLARIYRVGTELHINSQIKPVVADHALAMHRRLVETVPFARASGGIVVGTGTRNIAVSAGKWWEGLNTFSTTALDTSITGTFSHYHKDGVGGWTKLTGQTQINNAQYDDGSGTLATLGNNRYGVHWVYLAVDSDVTVLFGEGSYVLDDAISAPIPSTIPPELMADSRLIGKIIILKDSTTFESVQSIFFNVFDASTASGTTAASNVTITDAGGYFTGTEVETALQEVGSALLGLTNEATIIPVTQATHGFVAGQALYITGGAYSLAQANSESTSFVAGLVLSTQDANNFKLITSGSITGLTGLTANSVYYLSPTVAGGLTTTKPLSAGQFEVPLLLTDSTTSGYVLNGRPIAAGVAFSSVDNNWSVDQTFGGNAIINPKLQGYEETASAITSSAGALTVNASISNVKTVAMTENITSISFVWPTSGNGSVTVKFKQDVAGGKTIAFPASVKWDENGAPTLNTTASTSTFISFVTFDGGTTVFAFLGGTGYAG